MTNVKDTFRDMLYEFTATGEARDLLTEYYGRPGYDPNLRLSPLNAHHRPQPHVNLIRALSGGAGAGMAREVGGCPGPPQRPGS